MQLFRHQKKSLKHAEDNDVVFDCSDPGTGKTAVAIMDYARRRKKKGGAALVLAPRSLLRSTWFNDFKKFAPHLKVSVATAVDRGAMFDVDADVYVTNTDAAKWLAAQKPAFFKKFDTLIIDESSAYKHATTQRSKAAAKISKFFVYRRAMTGTPNGRSITDVFHQIFILDGGRRLGKSFFAFRNTVCEPKQVGRNANAIQWTDKDGAEEAVFGLIQDITIRHKFEDCTDIPACHRYTLPYQMTAKQRKAYDMMQDQQLLVLTDMKKKGTIITAVNAAVVMGKLLQVASGAIYETPDKYHLIDDGRYKMVLDLVEERQHTLVFFHWKHQRDCMVDEAKKRGLRYAVLDGGTKDAEREAIVLKYQAGMLDVVFAHPKSAAHGLTFTRGATTIWASPTADLELYEQGSKRQHRIGQDKKTEVITILAEDSQDERVYHDILMPKSKRMTNLLDLLAL